MKASFRILYRQLLLILCCCLLATVLTGIAIGLNDYLIQLPSLIRQILVSLHQGAILGDKIAPIYILLIGLAVFALGLKTIVEGRYNLLFQSAPPIIASVLRIIALLIIIPLAICVETGVAYRLGTDWFDMSESEAAKFLSIHGGSAFGSPLAIVYLLVVSIALITLIILSRKNNRIHKEKTRQNFQPKSKKTPLVQNSSVNSSIFSRKVKLAIIYASIAVLGILYYLTSISFVAIAIAFTVAIVSAVILGKKFIGGREQQPSLTIPHEQEAESITMLRAIPDSMLRVSHDGICLSYIPAKEATSFTLQGNIINKHLTEFLALEIAGKLIKSIQLSLQTGSTIECRFSIPVENRKQHHEAREQHHEARVTPIGQTEVLILVREINDLGYTSSVTEQSLANQENIAPVQLLTEPELVRVLDTVLQDIEQNQQNHILLCLAINSSVISDDDAVINDDLLFQIANRIGSALPSSVISRLEEHNLIILVSDRTIEKASAIVDDLHRNLEEFISAENHPHSIEFSVALLGIDADSSDAIALVSAAKATCQMAKQKVSFKTFW